MVHGNAQQRRVRPQYYGWSGGGGGSVTRRDQSTSEHSTPTTSAKDHYHVTISVCSTTCSTALLAMAHSLATCHSAEIGDTRFPLPNFAAPVHRVPDEILINVFECSMNLCERTIPRLWKLAQVCSRWATAVRNAPTLWTLILASYTPEQISLVLRESKAAPLNMIFDPDSLLDLDGIDPHHALSSRPLKSLSIRSRKPQACNCSSKLMLGHLEILIVECVGDRPQVEWIVPGNVPRLKRLDLTEVLLPWQVPGAFAHLEVLNLTFGSRLDLGFPVGYLRPMVWDILTYFHSSPSLREVRIHNAQALSKPQVLEGWPSLCLPRLLTLHLHIAQWAAAFLYNT
jgi:hypothetical protein